jgi:hypothetical protein
MAAKEETMNNGERLLSLMEKMDKEEMLDFLVSLDTKEFKCLAAEALKNMLEEGDNGMTMLIERAAAKRYHLEQQKGGELYDKYLSFETKQEREEYRKLLTEENRSLLDRTMWSMRSGGDAVVHLLKKTVKPTPKRAISSLAVGSLAATGAGVSGASVGSVVGAGVCATVLADLIITGFEEDEATRRFGQGLRSFFVDRPRGWWQKLAVRNNG